MHVCAIDSTVYLLKTLAISRSDWLEGLFYVQLTEKERDHLSYRLCKFHKAVCRTKQAIVNNDRFTYRQKLCILCLPGKCNVSEGRKLVKCVFLISILFNK